MFRPAARSALHALDDVLRGAVGAGHDVDLASRRTPDMPIGSRMPSCESMMNSCGRMCRISVRGDRDRASRVDHAIDVAGRDFLVADRDDAVRVQAAHVTARNAGEHRVNLAAGHQLGFLDRALDRLHGRVDVDDDALLEPARRMRPDADHFDRAVGAELADDRNDFRSADVEADDQVSFDFSNHPGQRPPQTRAQATNDRSSRR